MTVKQGSGPWCLEGAGWGCSCRMAQNEDTRSSDVWDEQSWINGGQSGVQYRV